MKFGDFLRALVVGLSLVVCCCADKESEEYKREEKNHPEGLDDYSKHHKRKENVLGKLPADVRALIEAGGANPFKNVSVSEMKKLPSSVYAHIGKDALQNLDNQQLESVARGFNDGTSKRDLENILEDVRLDQFEHIMESVQNESRIFSKSQKEAFVGQMVARNGDPSSWTKDQVAQLGALVNGLDPKQIKSLAKADREVFEESLKQMRGAGVRDLTRGQQRAVVAAARDKFGSGEDWDAEVVRKMAEFIPHMKQKDIKELPADAVGSSVKYLGQAEWDASQARVMMKKIRNESSGYGAPESWTGEQLKNLGNLVSGFTPKDIKQLKKDAFKDALPVFGKTELNKAQARVLAKQAADSLGDLQNWSVENVSNSGNVLLGFRAKQLAKLPTGAIVHSLKKIRQLHFAKDQARAVVERVRSSLGDPSSWNASVVEDLGPLMKGLSLSDLQRLPAAALKSTLKSLKSDRTIAPAKRRAVLKKAMSAGEVRLVEVGNFLKTFSLNDLENVDIEKDLGLSGDYESNSTDEQERAALAWKVSQARSVLKKVEVKWGKPNDSNSTWSLANVRRLGGLVKGFWRRLIAALPEEEYRDIVEFFSEFDDWMPGQSQEIALRYKEKLGYRVPEDFAQMDEVDVSSLGAFVAELDEQELGQLPAGACAEAVRQLGRARFTEIPPAVRRKKAQDALNMLGRARGVEGGVRAEELTVEELQDMGSAALGLEPRELQQLQPEVFKGAVAWLGEQENFEEDQFAALVNLVKKAYKGDGPVEAAASQLSASSVRDLGFILRGFSKEDLRNLPKEIVEENLDVFGAVPLSREQAAVVVAKIEPARKRRETDYSSMTGDELIAMGTTLVGLAPAHIASVSHVAFDEAVATIGQVSGFSQEQLDAWAVLAKEAWNDDISLLTADQLLRLGVVAVGFSPEDLAQLKLDSDDVIESLGELPIVTKLSAGYSADQLDAAFARIKALKGKQAAHFTGDELAALGNFALALTPSEIGQISDASYQSAAASLGGLVGWSQAQLGQLKAKAVAVYGDVTTWSPEQLREAGAAIGGFSKEEIQALTAEPIELIPAGALIQIPPETFQAFSTSQLEMFSSTQALLVTSEQRAVLSVEQLNVLRAKEGREPVVSNSSGTQLIAMVTVLGVTCLTVACEETRLQ